LGFRFGLAFSICALELSQRLGLVLHPVLVLEIELTMAMAVNNERTFSAYLLRLRFSHSCCLTIEMTRIDALHLFWFVRKENCSQAEAIAKLERLFEATLAELGPPTPTHFVISAFEARDNPAAGGQWEPFLSYLLKCASERA